MQQQYQDQMAIVRKRGKPDFFITFTCNPQWPEVTEMLLRDQKVTGRGISMLHATFITFITSKTRA